MATFNKLNINPLPNNKVKVDIKIKDSEEKEKTVTFNLEFNYREVCKYWTVTIRDTYNNDIVSNVPLVSGGGYLEMGNLLRQFGYKNIGGLMLYKSKQTTLDNPDEYSLGNDFYLIWCDTASNYIKEVQ